MSAENPHSQIDTQGRLRHLLSLDGLPRTIVESLLDSAESIRGQRPDALRQTLAGRTLCTLFFEPSTRTRGSFQLAGQRLGMDVLNLDLATSSAGKGESAADTLRTLAAMGVQVFAVRHRDDGALAALAGSMAPGSAVINAGDGRSNHPTQGLLDMLTLRQAKGADFSRLTVLMVGDVRHSRVARSDLQALRTLGCGAIRICAPAGLLPDADELAGCEVIADFDAAIAGVDAVFTLRLQRERMQQGLAPSTEDYFRDYGLSADRLRRAAPDAVVLHPGPINRGVEISDQVADGSQSLILRQVANGVPLRMAVLRALFRV